MGSQNGFDHHSQIKAAAFFFLRRHARRPQNARHNCDPPKRALCCGWLRNPTLKSHGKPDGSLVFTLKPNHSRACMVRNGFRNHPQYTLFHQIRLRATEACQSHILACQGLNGPMQVLSLLLVSRESNHCSEAPKGLTFVTKSRQDNKINSMGYGEWPRQYVAA